MKTLVDEALQQAAAARRQGDREGGLPISGASGRESCQVLSSEPMRTSFRSPTWKGGQMASSREYRKLAADCTRLAQAAPSQKAGAGFAAAARGWLMLARLVEREETWEEKGSPQVTEKSENAG
jgi:hypothetical protein